MERDTGRGRPESRPAFRFGSAVIPLPLRRANSATQLTERKFVDIAQRMWSRFCSEATELISNTDIPFLDPPTLTPKGLRDEFTLPKQAIKRDILGLPQGKNRGLEFAYRYFAVAENVDGQQYNPQVRITRLGILQLLALNLAYRYSTRGEAHSDKSVIRSNESMQPTDENVRHQAYRRMMSSLPKKGGPLMTVKP